MLLTKIYLTGGLILIAAVLVNLLAAWLGLPTWYTFLQQAAENGLSRAAARAGLAGMTFLLLVYPFLLGAAAYLAFKWLKLT
jgi:hypothetical protein